MKVNVLGFSLVSDNKYVSLPYFLNYLEMTKNGKRCVYAHCERHFYFNTSENPDYYYGMVITVKDQKSFCKFKDVNGNIVITVQNLLKNEKLLDFNFFCINKSNGLGVYMYYHQSCTVRELGNNLKKWFYDLRDNLKKRAISHPAAEHVGLSNKKLEKKSNIKYKGLLKFSVLVRKEELQQVLLKMKKIKTVEITLDAIAQSPARPGVPLSDKSRRVSEKFTIGQGWGVQAIVDDIMGLPGLDGLKKGRVACVDENDFESYINFFNSPDNFGEHDYDDLTYRINNLQADLFYKHDIFDELVGVMESEKYEEIFQPEIEEI